MHIILVNGMVFCEVLACTLSKYHIVAGLRQCKDAVLVCVFERPC